MRNAIVKFFDTAKGWGFLMDSETNEDVFFHYSQIQMEGFKSLHENDMVEYELGAGNNGREQATNIKSILTMKMIEDSLKEECLYVRKMKDAFGQRAYMVVDQNNVVKSSEQGMTFADLAAFAGF